MMQVDYPSQVCDELIEVLRYLPKADYAMLPDDFINYLYQNCNSESTFVYNCAKPLMEQKLSREAIAALKSIGERYWGWKP